MPLFYNTEAPDARTPVVASVIKDVHLRTARRAEAQDRPEAASTTDHEDLLLGFLQHGALAIGRRTRRLETVTSVAVAKDDVSVTLPENMRLASVVYTTNSGTPTVLMVASGKAVAQLGEDEDLCFYGVWAGVVYLNAPVPEDGTITFYGLSQSAVEPGGATSLVDTFPPELTAALVYYVLAEWYESSGDYGSSSYYGEKYEAELRLHGQSTHRAKARRRYRPLM